MKIRLNSKFKKKISFIYIHIHLIVKNLKKIAKKRKIRKKNGQNIRRIHVVPCCQWRTILVGHIGHASRGNNK